MQIPSILAETLTDLDGQIREQEETEHPEYPR